MPLDPRTWAQFDMVTASRLDGDLYTVNGSAFLPTGVQFHARKPLYKATQANSPVTVQAGAWRGMFEGLGASVLVDNSGYYGALMDPNYGGTIADAIAYSNGNPNLPQGSSGSLIGGGGGWYLLSAFTPIAGASGSLYRASLTNGWQGANPNLISTGTAMAGNASHDVAPWVADLVFFDGGSYTAVVQNGGSADQPLRTTVDGSGETCYFNAQWASVSAQWGTAAASAPSPRASWTSGSTVTASFLNGNQGIRDVLRCLNFPPALRVSTSVSTSVANANGNGGGTVINLGTPGLDSYSGWASGPNHYTAPFAGLYLAYGVVGFQSSGSNVPARAGLQINGSTNLWGPWSSMPAGNDNSVAKVALLDLHAGDTVALQGEQNQGSALGTATNSPPVLVLYWLGNLTAPSPLPALPDLSYRYPAGGATLAAFSSHLANDLTFLTSRPFLLSQQGSSQAIPQSTSTALTMDTITGQVHGTAGDPWSGWDATHHRYVAPVSGWYLATMEVFFPQASLTVTPSTIAQMRPSTNGAAGSNWDWYSHQNLPTTLNGGGASGLAWYYLRAGDWIQPGVQTQDTASGSFSTQVTSPSSHFECVWVSS